MDGVLVENAQHDIYSYKRCEDQERYCGQGSSKNLRRALEVAVDRGGHVQVAHRRFDRRLCGAERPSRRQVERNRRRNEAALVVDLDCRMVVDRRGQGGQRHHHFGGRAVGAAARRAATAVGYRVCRLVCLSAGVERIRARCRGLGRHDRCERFHAADGAARHLGLLRSGHIAGRRAEENPIELLRILPIFRCDLHHHKILVERIIDGRDGALTESVVEHGVDLIRCETIARRRVAVDRHIGLQPVLLHVGIDVSQLPPMLAKLCNQLGHEGVYCISVVAAQGVLILCRRLPAADMQILLRLQK